MTGRKRTAKPKKRKLSLNEIGRCHPSLTRKQKGKGGKCLPEWLYRKPRKGKSTTCKTGEDHCILDGADISQEKKQMLRMRYLRPRRPAEWDKDPDMWLDNFNIQNAMNQYVKAYDWFRFLGVFPIDFSAPNPYRKTGRPQCLNQVLCSLNLPQERKNGVRGIGMIFNLDPHYKGGSHWVALYIHLPEHGSPFIGYFDSYGYEVPAMIARFMRSFTLQIKECILGYNARRFQYGNSECGMFSMYFLICMIHGIPFEDFCKDAIHDRSMLELRQVLFSH